MEHEPVRPTLTDRQLAWCRRNIKAFDIAWRAAKAADDHKAKVYEKMDVVPGTVGVPSEQQEAAS